MLSNPQQEHIGRVTTALQIITSALAFGVLVFAIVVISMQPEQAAADDGGSNGLIAAGMAVVALVASVIVPGIMRANMRRTIADGKPLGLNVAAPAAKELGDVGALATVFQATRIVGAAILEGAAFYNLIAFMFGRQTINLAFAAGLLIAILFKFPTRGAVESWINDELKLLEELRAFKE